MKKIQDMNGNNIFVKVGFTTATTFKSNETNKAYIKLTYVGSTEPQIVGPFQDVATAEKIIESLC